MPGNSASDLCEGEWVSEWVKTWPEIKGFLSVTSIERSRLESPGEQFFMVVSNWMNPISTLKRNGWKSLDIHLKLPGSTCDPRECVIKISGIDLKSRECFIKKELQIGSLGPLKIVRRHLQPRICFCNVFVLLLCRFFVGPRHSFAFKVNQNSL